LLTITAPNRFVLQWVKDRFLPVIEQLAREAASDRVEVVLQLASQSHATNMMPAAPPPAPSAVDTSKARVREHSRLNPSFTFDSFVNGKANQLAYQHKAFDGFKKYYHSLDLLLIDDIQFFSGKNRTQEEFFYAFNALIDAHKQVIITCDSYPKEITGMEDRLISRFGWGLTVAIEPPELEMRVAILIKKADVAFFIAKHIQSNVRELEGALKRVLAYSNFAGQPLSLDLAREALKDVLAIQFRQVSIDNIQRTVADYYKIKVSEMYSKKRSRNVARPRQIAMALAKELTQLSLPDIGDAFGGRDHTTVLHACRKVAELKSDSPEISRDFEALLQVLRS